MDMCRFAGFDDPEFKKVDAALRHITGLMQSRHRTPETAPLARVLNEENRRLLLDSLRFEQVDARMMSVRSAHEKTCKWLLKKAEYVDWLDPGKLSDHYGFLWLKGKPGTGKSTLMKFALTNARKSMKDTLVISFFFNARGADMEKSTAGMYRSLLLQLLERVPRLQDVFETLGFTDWNSSSTYVWSIETLKDLFREAIHSLGELAVVCFIDALDECDQAEVRDMVAFFQRLGDLTVPLGVRFRVFFSSRHYPHITISHGIDFVLEGQEGHDQDITDYIDSELHPELRTGDTASLGIRETLQKKSAGVFMWVVLVIGILNKEYDDGEFAASQLRQRQVQRKLDEIPSDLHELFRDILTRDARKKDRLILSLQWLLFARRPLRPAELYFAIISGIEPTDLPAYISSQPGLDQMEKFILNSSKGLAEVIKSKKLTVQFIHESVRDFLLKEKGLSAVWTDLRPTFVGQSHDRLKQCCLSYIAEIDIGTANLGISDPLPKASSAEGKELRQQTGKHFPFLQYAVENILWHADTAQAGGICQVKFLRELVPPTLVTLGNICAPYDNRRHKSIPSLLYILAQHNLPALIRINPNKCDCFVVEDERYGPPIFAALACGNREAVTAMLEVQERLHGEDCARAKDWESTGKDTLTSFSREFCFSRQTGVFGYLKKIDDPVLMGFALGSSAADLDSKIKITGRTTTLLHIAVDVGNKAAVRTLLERGHIVDMKDYAGLTPLLLAAKNGHQALVQLLLDRGAAIESSGGVGTDYARTPLALAAENGHEAVVQSLLDRGAKIDAKANSGWTPLLYAAMDGREAVVRLLLDRGATIDVKDRIGLTPLTLAAHNGHKAVVQFLLDRGAAIDAKDCDGRTPLALAAEYGREAVVKFLLDQGAAIEATGCDGQTPLTLATKSTKNDHKAVVQLLLDYGATYPDSEEL
jgi:ankyrin repeat protein